MSTIALKNTAVKAKSITAALAVASALALPQLFHAAGILSGTGAALGSAFLPMQLPVLLAGLLGGTVVGVIAGAASPVVSFLISGMPSAVILPFILLELAAYGLVGGFLSKVKMPVWAKLLLIQAAGRIVRALAVVVAVYGLGSGTVPVSSVWSMVTEGIPGILLQWALIPLLLYRMKGLKKYYE